MTYERPRIEERVRVTDPVIIGGEPGPVSGPVGGPPSPTWAPHEADEEGS